MSGAYEDLEGKVAVVLGASDGIGRETSLLLAEHGVRLAVVARRRDPLEALAEEIDSAGGVAVGVEADSTSATDLDRVRKEALRLYGGVDILIAFVGGGVTRVGVEEIDDATWTDVIERNLTATFLATRAFIPVLAEGRGPSIVTMGSVAGQQVDMPLSAVYAAAKAGVAQFTRHVALEVGPRGIRANCLAPSTTLSPRVVKTLEGNPGLGQEVLDITPLGRLGEPLDIAHAALYLSSDVSSWLTGATLDLGGGRVMR